VLALLALLAPPPGWTSEGEPIKKLVVALPFDEVELIVRAEAQRQNLNLVNVLDIQKGMENRGGTFKPYKVLQFCNLELGIQVYADLPDAGAFQLCGVLLYEPAAGRTALVSARQGWVLRALAGSRPGPAAQDAARRFERIIDEIFEAVAEEDRARRR
jgi:uncharacterized protein (DUF302 family)